MKWPARIISLLVLAIVVTPAGASIRPLVCEASGTFDIFGDLRGSGTCMGDLEGPYTVEIASTEGTGTGECDFPAHVVDFDMTVTLRNARTAQVTVLDQNWKMYAAFPESVFAMIVRATDVVNPPIRGAGVLVTQLFNAVNCLDNTFPDGPTSASVRWAFLRGI